MRISSELADTVVKPTSVLSLEAGGISRNFGFLVAGLLLGANFGLVVIAIAIFQRMNPFAPFMRHWLFFGLWLGPVSVTYVLVHTGQLGYALLLLPAVFLLVGSSLAGMFGHSRAREGYRGVQSMAAPVRAYAAAVMVVALGAVSAGMFMFFPRAINAVANSGGPSAVVQGISLNIAEDPPPPAQSGSSVNLPDRTRPFDLRVNDKHWHSMINFVNAFQSYEVAILTAPNWEGSFRHLTYYLPEYRVYGVGHDLNGRFGLLFSAYGGTSDYSLENLARSSSMLRLDPQAHLLLIPDWEVARRVQGVEVTEFTLDSGATIAMAWAPENTTLTFAPY